MLYLSTKLSWQLYGLYNNEIAAAEAISQTFRQKTVTETSSLLDQTVPMNENNNTPTR